MDQRTSFIRRKSVLTTKGAVYVCVSLPSPATSPLTIAMPTNLDHSYTPTDKGTNQPVAQEQENSDMPIKDIRSYLTKGPESSSSTPPLPIKPTHPLPQRQPKLTLLRRIRNYILAFLLFRIARFRIFLIKWLDWRVGLLPKSIDIKPERRFWVQSSRVGCRKIEVHVHRPPTRLLQPPFPVHINLHGSGFVIPNMEEDREQCAFLSRTLNCVVLDVDYCKAPQYKLPAPVHDVLDVVRHVLDRPTEYDTTRITIGGVSAGATTALLASTSKELKQGTIKSVIAWYPCTNLQYGKEERIIPPIPQRTSYGKSAKVNIPGFLLPPWMMDLFMECAVEEGADLCDPSISPICTPGEAFPTLTIIVSPERCLSLVGATHVCLINQVGTHDPLYNDCIQLYHHIARYSKDIELHVVPYSTHAFERAGLGQDLDRGNMKEWAKQMDEVWGIVVRRLREVHTR